MFFIRFSLFHSVEAFCQLFLQNHAEALLIHHLTCGLLSQQYLRVDRIVYYVCCCYRCTHVCVADRLLSEIGTFVRAHGLGSNFDAVSAIDGTCEYRSYCHDEDRW